jgi:hypothetical protein
MFTGRDALSTVEQAISRARADEHSLDAALRSATEEAAQHRSTEAEGFRSLARVRLDELLREKVIGDLDVAERQALAMLENHKRQVEDLARRRDQCQAALDRAEERKHDRDQVLADALEDLDELEDKTAEHLKGETRWHDAKEAVDDAQAIAANAEEKAELAETDLGDKGKPYVNDPLFIYLWTKKHAQAEDRSGNFVRFFDRKVARLIGYSGARANFAMLQEIPARLREHAKNKQAELDEAKRKLAVVEREALVAAGVEPLETRVEAAHAGMKTVEDEVVKVTAELKRIDDERAKVIDADENEGGAVDLLASALAREDLNELLNEASRTPTKADDKAITSIAGARAAREKADAEIRQTRADIREMAKRRTELEEARDRARSIGYDDPRGRFDGAQDIILQVVAGILTGALRGYALDRVLRDTFRPGRRRGDYDFGRWGEMGPGGLPGPWGLPPTLPGPWGGMPGPLPGPWGGGGGGGWRTGGRMGGGGGGGGWKTGGRF